MNVDNLLHKVAVVNGVNVRFERKLLKTSSENEILHRVDRLIKAVRKVYDDLLLDDSDRPPCIFMDGWSFSVGKYCHSIELPVPSGLDEDWFQFFLDMYHHVLKNTFGTGLVQNLHAYNDSFVFTKISSASAPAAQIFKLRTHVQNGVTVPGLYMMFAVSKEWLST